MASKIKIKRSAVAGKVPLTTDLELSELAVNTNDGRLYTKKDDGTESIVEIGGPDFGGRNVTTTGTSTAASFIPSSSTVPTNGVYLPAANSVAISTNSVGRVFVDASGDSLFQGQVFGRRVAGAGRVFVDRVEGSYASPTAVGAANVGALIGRGYDGTQFRDTGNLTFISDGTITSSSSPGSVVLATTPSSSTSPIERLRITSAGLVGIGTTSPSALLHVSATNANIRIGVDASSQYTDIFRDNVTGFTVYNAAQAGAFRGHVWQLGGTEAARIDSSGRLLVGTSSDSGGALLQVNGDRIRVGTAKTPASATATGTAGEICWDASYVYVCTATNTWKRSALSTW